MHRSRRPGNANFSGQEKLLLQTTGFLGDQLIQSIGRGAGWLLDEEDQKRLLQSAVSESQKEQAELNSCSRQETSLSPC